MVQNVWNLWQTVIKQGHHVSDSKTLNPKFTTIMVWIQWIWVHVYESECVDLLADINNTYKHEKTPVWFQHLMFTLAKCASCEIEAFLTNICELKASTRTVWLLEELSFKKCLLRYT